MGKDSEVARRSLDQRRLNFNVLVIETLKKFRGVRDKFSPMLLCHNRLAVCHPVSAFNTYVRSSHLVIVLVCLQEV